MPEFDALPCWEVPVQHTVTSDVGSLSDDDNPVFVIMHKRCQALRGEVPEGEGRAFDAGDKRVAVFNLAGSFYAIDDSCPHAGPHLALRIPGLDKQRVGQRVVYLAQESPGSRLGEARDVVEVGVGTIGVVRVSVAWLLGSGGQEQGGVVRQRIQNRGASTSER